VVVVVESNVTPGSPSGTYSVTAFFSPCFLSFANDNEPMPRPFVSEENCTDRLTGPGVLLSIKDIFLLCDAGLSVEVTTFFAQFPKLTSPVTFGLPDPDTREISDPKTAKPEVCPSS
jgi:hypothetical protein